jgi:hypothetical protein
MLTPEQEDEFHYFSLFMTKIHTTVISLRDNVRTRKTIGTQLFCNEVSVPSKQSERSSILPHITMFDKQAVENERRCQAMDSCCFFN